MQNWTPIALLIAVVVLLSGVAVVIQKTYPSAPLPSPVSTSTGKVVPAASTQPNIAYSMVLRPSVATARIGETVVFEVYSPTNTVYVDGIEAVFRYDPKALKITKVQPGSLFDKPQTLLNKIDKTTVRFSAVTFSPVVNSGQLMTIEATVLSDKSNAALQFDRSKTIVALVVPATKTPIGAKQLELNFTEEPFSLLP